jgi:RHS repeat-associated protein
VAGTVTLVASATDTGGHAFSREATVYVNNADGTSPFSSNLTGASAGSAFAMRFVTPATGAIVAGNTPVVATIEGALTPNWVLEYAPVGSINPYDLAAVDPDWIPLGNGTGFLTNQTAGTFPAATLANGIYFLRLSATPTAGGSTTYHGQVVAKGVAPQDIQPRVTLTAPAQGSTVPLTVPITGSITSMRPLVEWFAEYAPASTVDLNNLGSNEPPWRRFAQGTTTIANSLIANFDASLVPDGSYIVRIVAWNDIRLGWAEPLPLEVSGSVKLGRLRVEFTDLNLPVGNIPFTIRRIYDSLDASRDEGLGFGWSLAFFDADIGETVPRTGAGAFGATPFREGTRVYINTPDGKRAGFTFHAEFGVGGLFGAVYRAVFIPDPGVYEKLETPEGSDPFLSIDSNGNAFLAFLGFAWNPSTYILTTPEGLRYTYDENTGFVEARDLSGNTLVATANGLRHSTGASVQLVRNAQGRITQLVAPDGVTVDYGYSAAGDLTTVTDDDGRVTTFGYHASPPHFLKDVTDPFGRVGVRYDSVNVIGPTDFFTIAASYNERVLQRLQWTLSTDFFNGPDLHFVRDASDRVTEIRRYRGSDTTLRSKTTFTWDALDRLVGQSHLTGAGAPLHADAVSTLTRDAESRVTSIARAGDTTTNTFDMLGQLTAVTHTAGAAESYTYNSMGVRTASHLVPGPSTVGAGNRLVAAGPLAFTYDAEGNVTQKVETVSGQVTRFSYDHRNQLVLATIHPNAAAPPATTVAFEYDYVGRMMSRSLNGAKTWIVYERQMPVAEFADGAPTMNAAFFYAPDRLDDFHAVWRAGTGVRMLLKDHLGTVLGATDDLGALAWWTTYDAFGNLRGPAPAGGEPLRFAGRFYNDTLGLYEMRARYYDPRLGRFTQEDPIGFDGGDMNLYGYAKNNPLNFIDPTGRALTPENALLLGILVGLGSAWSGISILGTITINIEIVLIVAVLYLYY